MMQELVLIGADMDRATIEQTLDNCLLTDDELNAGENAWLAMPDPFPARPAPAPAPAESAV